MIMMGKFIRHIWVYKEPLVPLSYEPPPTISTEKECRSTESLIICSDLQGDKAACHMYIGVGGFKVST